MEDDVGRNRKRTIKMRGAEETSSVRLEKAVSAKSD